METLEEWAGEVPAGLDAAQRARYVNLCKAQIAQIAEFRKGGAAGRMAAVAVSELEREKQELLVAAGAQDGVGRFMVRQLGEAGVKLRSKGQ